MQYPMMPHRLKFGLTARSLPESHFRYIRILAENAITAMRRLLLILMLLILPLQAGWAAAAVYCQHESSPKVQHLGHHEHQHSASNDDSKSGQSKSSPVVDNDCAFCHLAGIGVLPLPAPVVQFDVLQVTTESPSDPLLASIRLERPERPKWVPALL
jgi:hypothetical protein